MNTILRALMFLVMAAAVVGAFWVPDAQMFSQPSLARIIFFHLPEAVACTLFLFGGAYFGAKYLATRSLIWDRRSTTCLHITGVLGVLTLVTGILFSKMQWGAWWGWDPRQTSFLMVMLIVGAYFALRSAYTDEAKRAAIAAAYQLATLLPILFLIFVYPRLPSVVSLHPETRFTGTFDPNYKVVEWSVFAMLFATCVWMYKLSMRAHALESELENLHGELANRDDSAAAGVVRPISLPTDGG